MPMLCENFSLLLNDIALCASSWDHLCGATSADRSSNAPEGPTAEKLYKYLKKLYGLIRYLYMASLDLHKLGPEEYP